MAARSINLIAGLFALLALLPASLAIAAERPNMLVMGEDVDRDSVPRNNRIYKRVVDAMNEQMNIRGFNVYDETAVSMEFTAPNRVRRRDAELIEIARAIPNPPIDVVLIFTIYASKRKFIYTDMTRPVVRITGRLLNVRTGRMIGNFETGGNIRLNPLPRHCDTECLLERVGEEARILANDLGAALSFKLRSFIAAGVRRRPAQRAPGTVAATSNRPATSHAGGASSRCNGMPTAYVLSFDGFTRPEIQQMEQFMAAFSCYEHHRPLQVSTSMSVYWYESQAQSARLMSNIRAMMGQLGIAAAVEMRSNKFSIRKVQTR